MPTVLITGSNRGLGLEFARQYAAAGWRVLASCRNPAQAGDLRALGGAVELLAMDVADHGAVEALAGRLEGVAIDLLVDNAGIMAARHTVFGETDYQEWERLLRVNLLGPMKVTECFVTHVAASEMKKIVALSSIMASIADNASGDWYDYRTSKAALNIAVKGWSAELAGRGIAVAALHPGWARTNMGGAGAMVDPVDSVAGLRKVIADLTLESSGRFITYQGKELSW